MEQQETTPVYRKRKSNQEPFDKRLIMDIVRQIENGVPRKEIRERYGVAANTVVTWMGRYASPAYQTVKRRFFSREQKRVVLQALEKGLSVKEASVSFGINDSQMIRRWIKEKQQEDAELVRNAPPMAKEKKPVKTSGDHRLADQLAEAQLKIRALEMMIDLAEEQFKIDIRKKSGAKPSAK